MSVSINTFDVEISKNIDEILFNEILYKSITLLKTVKGSASNYLLDSNRLTNTTDNMNVHIIEKLVYDIAKKHCLELNIKIEDIHWI